VSYDFPFAKLTSISGYQINNGTSNTDQSLTYQAALGASHQSSLRAARV
jgi:hypothetical protein